MSGSSDLVREVALKEYVHPAIASGKSRFSISVKDLMKELRPKGFPSGNYPQICSSIKERNFLKGNGIQVVGFDGPPSCQSSTVVVHYEVLQTGTPMAGQEVELADGYIAPKTEEADTARVLQLMESLRGLLREELAEYGGGEAFIRWVRSEEPSPSEPGGQH